MRKMWDERVSTKEISKQRIQYISKRKFKELIDHLVRHEDCECCHIKNFCENARKENHIGWSCNEALIAYLFSKPDHKSHIEDSCLLNFGNEYVAVSRFIARKAEICDGTHYKADVVLVDKDGIIWSVWYPFDKEQYNDPHYFILYRRAYEKGKYVDKLRISDGDETYDIKALSDYHSESRAAKLAQPLYDSIKYVGLKTINGVEYAVYNPYNSYEKESATGYPFYIITTPDGSYDESGEYPETRFTTEEETIQIMESEK